METDFVFRSIFNGTKLAAGFLFYIIIHLFLMLLPFFVLISTMPLLSESVLAIKDPIRYGVIQIAMISYVFALIIWWILLIFIDPIKIAKKMIKISEEDE